MPKTTRSHGKQTIPRDLRKTMKETIREYWNSRDEMYREQVRNYEREREAEVNKILTFLGKVPAPKGNPASSK
jgi:hypothetical protein